MGGDVSRAVTYIVCQRTAQQYTARRTGHHGLQVDKREAEFSALSSASDSEAVNVITRSQDELCVRLESVNENVREQSAWCTTPLKACSKPQRAFLQILY